MTPCEKRGWKVGDKFQRIGDRVSFGNHKPGDLLTLKKDDGSNAPFFENESSGGMAFCLLSDLIPLSFRIQPGDYIDTTGFDESQRREVVQGFLDAGAPEGEGMRYSNMSWHFIGWSNTGVFYCEDDAFKQAGFTRQITLSQLLGTSKQAPTEWNGEGLPPVGTKCEATWGAKWEWHKAFILDSNSFAFFSEILGQWFIDPTEGAEFRKPLSGDALLAEQLQRDANIKPKAAARVIAAGYRK